MPVPFSLNTILVVLIDLLGLFLAFWVYWTNRSGKVNRGFFLMVVFILAWVTFYYLAQYSLSTLWFRLSAASVFLFFIAYYFFIVRWFLEKKRWYKILSYSVLIYGLVFAALAVKTDFIIESSETIGLVVRPVFPPIGWWAFYGFVIFLTLLINWALIREYVKYPKERKSQIQYFLTGLLFFAGLNFVFNVILPVFFNMYRFYELGNYSAIFLLGLTAYAIVKQELFGIRVLLTALFIALIAVLFLLDIALFTPLLLIKLYKGLVLAIFLYLGYLLIRSVVTEIKQRGQLQEAYKKLEELDRTKSEFVSIASHQLRTPLTAMKGYISMILEGTYGKLDTKQKKPIESVYESSERLIRLVNDLLNVSRIESGKTEMKWEQGSVETIIQSVVEELGIKLKERNVELIFEKPENSLPLIRIDKEKIRNVVLNIVDNAIRYTSQGKITLSAVAQQQNVLIRIQDTGEGMTQEEIGKLFKTFSRGGAGMKFSTEGAGLGLYIARKFLEMHKGRIWVESAGKGQGSTFFVELPVA